MKKILYCAMTVFLLTGTAAWAGDCQSAIADFDARAAKVTGKDAATVAEAQTLRDMAAQACDAGKEAEAAVHLEQARLALGLSN